MLSHNNNILIHHFLEMNACILPDKCAMVHGDERISYKVLNRDANRLAKWFLDNGLAPGDRVALLMENCREYLVGYYGCLKAGAVAVPLNPDLKSENLAALLSSIKPRVIISSTKSERTLKFLDFPGSSKARLLIARPRLKWGEPSIAVDSFEEITESGDGAS
jgi:long-chain acyl-CoA synthetase